MRAGNLDIDTLADDRDTAAEQPQPYSDQLQLLSDVYAALDDRLAHRVEAMQSLSTRVEEPTLPGLVITNDEARRLAEPHARQGPTPVTEEPFQPGLWQAVLPRVEASRQAGRMLPLHIVAERFGLTPFEVDCLLVCLAPEVDRRYATLVAYLNDDITRRWPSVALLLDLCAPGDDPPLAHRRFLADQAPLLHNGLLAWADAGHDPAVTPRLGRCLRVEEGVAAFLLGEPLLDSELVTLWDHPTAAPEAPALWQAAGVDGLIEPLLDAMLDPDRPSRRRARSQARVWLITGQQGSGRRWAVEHACAAKGIGLLAIDCRRLVLHPCPETVLRRAFRDALLHGMPLLLAQADCLAEAGECTQVLRLHLPRLVDELGWLLFLVASRPEPLRRWFAAGTCVEVGFPASTRTSREQHWHQVLQTEGMPERQTNGLASSLASTFRLTAGQIAEAHEAAAAEAEHRDDPDWRLLLHRSAARTAAPRLGELAQKLTPLYRLADIILPETKRELLLDVIRQVKHRHMVMEDWQFNTTMSRGKGISVLFSGPPGTGKTMAAEVIANELNMELYRIDLSSVVSKYIGETEKNLARIFDEAELSDSVLLFDEADALFGKRTEVKDAHDRYANIEINYLLQRMEGYEGVALLATNMRHNLDEAFMRRLRIVIEFPVPSPPDRLLIWKRVLPLRAPVADDVDYGFLAERFELTGGSIRNVGLTAAFLAAEEGTAIAMRHLVRGTARELIKLGRRRVDEQFGDYAVLLAMHESGAEEK